jgi:hypothetical protein
MNFMTNLVTISHKMLLKLFIVTRNELVVQNFPYLCRKM